MFDRPNAQTFKLYTYPITVVDVVDGDTIDVEIDLGFHITIDERIRLADVDTSEIHFVEEESTEYQEGMKHTEFVSDWIESSDSLYLYSEKYETGVYGRVVGDIYSDTHNEWLSETLYDSFESVELYE